MNTQNPDVSAKVSEICDQIHYVIKCSKLDFRIQQTPYSKSKSSDKLKSIECEKIKIEKETSISKQTLLKMHNKDIHDLDKVQTIKIEKVETEIETLREFKEKKNIEERKKEKRKKVKKKNKKLDEKFQNSGKI